MVSWGILDRMDKLTPRQRQIVGMFCSGWTGPQIAEALGLSSQTINPSLRQAARRMGARGIGRETLKAKAEATNNFSVYEGP